MAKRLISFFLMTFFTVQLSASFLNFDCNMLCCKEEVVSCCSTEEVKKECPTLGPNCYLVVFLPILSGPAAKMEIDKDLDVVDFHLCSTIGFIEIIAVDYYEAYPLAEPPPAFNFPLLI